MKKVIRKLIHILERVERQNKDTKIIIKRQDKKLFALTKYLNTGDGTLYYSKVNPCKGKKGDWK